MEIDQALKLLDTFTRGNLTGRLGSLENSFQGSGKDRANEILYSHNLDIGLLRAAFEIKGVAGQINVIVHALAILMALPKILGPDEKVVSMSLGAGNTGRQWDLETTRQIAEFKLIAWKGGAESIRQNGLFKDFYWLAEHETSKRRCLYVLGLRHPLKFLNGGRSISSVTSRDEHLATHFRKSYGDRYRKVSEYYLAKSSLVELIDLMPIVPELAGIEPLGDDQSQQLPAL